MSPITATLRRVVLTWCTTAPGGAEQSVTELAVAHHSPERQGQVLILPRRSPAVSTSR
jgi:hypothetical protein